MVNPKLYEVYSKEIIDNLIPTIEDMERKGRCAIAYGEIVYREWTFPRLVGIDGNHMEYIGNIPDMLYKLLTDEMIDEDDYTSPMAAPLALVEGKGGLPLWVQ